MMELELAKIIQYTISATPVGKRVEISFLGVAIPMDVSMRFAGGWIVSYTLIPGKSLEFIRGEDCYLDGITIVMQPYSGIK